MNQENFQELVHSQRDRLAYIELRVWFIGEIRRHDLAERFGIQTAAATRDLRLYKEMAPNNLEYNSRAKIYTIGQKFKPFFNFPPERVLAWLVNGFGDGDPVRSHTGIVCDIPNRLNMPDLNTLAAVTRAIHFQCPLHIRYHSLSSGTTDREIIPFALMDNGLRWHVRAFDRKKSAFRDFVLTRIQNPTVLRTGLVKFHERGDQDIQWTRIVELDLVPHPNRNHPEITRMDYGLHGSEDALHLKLRAATAGYVLRKWSVDCSPDHSLEGPEYRLWLRNPLALYGAESATLAPGYRAPESM